MEFLLTVAFIVLFAYIWVRIMGKTGHNQWLGLLMLIPLVNVGILIWLAFSEWPVERRAGTAGGDAGSLGS